MKSKRNFARAAATLAAALIVLPGCSPMMPKAPKTAAAVPATTPAESPIVEAYMEYVGPPERWAGPQTLVVHLTARDPELAQLSVNPPLADAGALVAPLANSTLAGPRRPVLDGGGRIGYGLARDSLTRLAASVKESADPNFSGCLYPLRLKLVHADGAVVERNGCRSTDGWPVVLSQITNSVITASVHPSTIGLPNRAVASH